MDSKRVLALTAVAFFYYEAIRVAEANDLRRCEGGWLSSSDLTIRRKAVRKLP